jgi:hypothetical protein
MTALTSAKFRVPQWELSASVFVLLLGATRQATMKFLVEVLRSGDEGERILGRLEIEEPTARKAQTKAQLLLAPWRNKGATKTRVLKYRKANQRSTRRLAVHGARRGVGERQNPAPERVGVIRDGAEHATFIAESRPNSGYYR